MPNMPAFVLSGGSILGAFQAGAIYQVLQDGFAPQAIFGVSAGALNGAFLADRAGRQLIAGKPLDWKLIGQQLIDFWINNVTDPSVLIEKKTGAGLLFDVLFDNFNGLVGTVHLKNLVHREIRPENLKKCFDAGLVYRAGTVNLMTGEMIYADASAAYLGNLIDYIYASTAISTPARQFRLQCRLSRSKISLSWTAEFAMSRHLAMPSNSEPPISFALYVSRFPSHPSEHRLRRKTL